MVNFLEHFPIFSSFHIISTALFFHFIGLHWTDHTTPKKTLPYVDDKQLFCTLTAFNKKKSNQDCSVPLKNADREVKRILSVKWLCHIHISHKYDSINIAGNCKVIKRPYIYFTKNQILSSICMYKNIDPWNLKNIQWLNFIFSRFKIVIQICWAFWLCYFCD
jgi:hypothetical protein